MDKSDVRAVLHACVPETVDRFYQEVGRGGRDGNACVSILVHTPEDRDTARDISKKKVITVDTGLGRWRCMIEHAKRDDASGRLRLRLDQRPPGVSGATEANNAWNLRTVVLLNRAELIKIESEHPPEVERDAEETDSDFQARCDQIMSDYAVTCPLCILEDSHLSQGVWKTRVEPVRQAMLQVGRANVAVMQDVLRGRREMSEVLSDAYTLRGDDIHVDPVRVCGGCSVCRAGHGNQTGFAFPEPGPIRFAQQDTNDALWRILGTETTLILVACPRSESQRTFRKKLLQFALPRLVRFGIREVALPLEFQVDKHCRELYRHAPSGFVVHRDIRHTDELRTDIPVPRVSVFLGTAPEPIPQALINLERPIHIVFAWEDTPDRNRVAAKYFERTVHSHFNDVLGRLSQ